jgi:mannose-6-phosphate isomerase-like protein (cupin superfamily)
MTRHVTLCAVGIAALSLAALAAQQAAVVTGDHSTPLRAVAAAGNVGISNAVLRDQDDIRVIRVVVEPGGKRITHEHTDVKFHLFIPVTSAMVLDLDGAPSVNVPAWQPYYMKKGTKHGFHNPGTAPVEIMEVFVK